MKSKLLFLFISSVIIQCKGHVLPILGGIAANTHDRIHAGVQDLAGTILGGISHGVDFNFGFNAHRNRPLPQKRPEETIVIVVDENDQNPNYPPNTQNHVKYPPNYEYGHGSDYQNNGNNHRRPVYNENSVYNNNNNYGQPQGPNYSGHLNKPGQGNNNFPNNPNQGYRPNQNYLGQGNRPYDQNNQNYGFQPNNQGQKYPLNNQNNQGQGYRPNEQNNQGQRYPTYGNQNFNQGYQPYDQGQDYRPNGQDNQGQSYRPYDQNQGFHNNNSNKQNIPSYPINNDNSNYGKEKPETQDKYTTQKIPNIADGASTTENLKEDYPLFVPLNPKDIEGDATNSNAPKRDTDNAKPKPAEDDDDDLPIDVRIKN